MMLRLLMVVGLLALVACATPAPAVLPVPVLCQVPAAFFATPDLPTAPTGDFTQRDVAEYLNDLYFYAVSGWDRLDAVNAWVTQHCE